MGKRDVSQDVFDKAYAAVQRKIKDRKFTAADVVPFAVLGMQVVEKLEVSGPEKKDLVVRLAQRLVQDYVPEEEQDNIELAVSTLLPGAIDQIVAASKGQLNLNLGSLKGCFGCK